MRSFLLLLAPLLFALGPLACAGTSPQQVEYLLGPGAAMPSGPIAVPERVGLGTVSIAPYLDQAGIVVETERGQVRAARFHTWAEPLEDGLRAYLRAEISRALGFDVYAFPSAEAFDLVIDVHVERLHATMQGSATAVATYRIARPRRRRRGGRVPLPRVGATPEGGLSRRRRGGDRAREGVGGSDRGRRLGHDDALSAPPSSAAAVARHVRRAHNTAPVVRQRKTGPVCPPDPPNPRSLNSGQ